MSLGSYTHYGFIQDPVENLGLVGALATDLNMGGHDITNVDNIEANSIITDTIIVNGDAAITGCISGGSGLPANLCEGALLGDDINMQSNDIINIASMTMLQNQPSNTTNFLTLSTINASGPPTSVPTNEGAVIWTKTDNKLWIWNGSAWQDITAALTWANVLSNGNTSGAVNPTISNPQNLVFSGAVRVGSGGSTLTAAATSDIIIGTGSAAAGSVNTVIGSATVSGSGANRVHLGSGSTSTVGGSNPSFAVNGTIGNSNGGNIAILGTVAQTGDIAVGQGSSASGGSAGNRIAIGVSAVAGSPAVSGGTAIGGSASATGSNAIAIGTSASASTTNGIAIGSSATVSASNGIAIGNGSVAPSGQNIAIGSSAVCTGTSGTGRISIGSGSNAGTTGVGDCIAIGTSTFSNKVGSLALGLSCQATGGSACAIGSSSIASGADAIVIGSTSTGSGNNAVAIGKNANVSHSNAVAIGISATTTANNQIMLGNNDTGGLTQVYGSVGTAGEVYTEGFFRSRATVGASISPSGPQTLTAGVGATVLAMPSTNYAQDYRSPTINGTADQLQLRQYQTITGFAMIEVTFAGAGPAGNGYIVGRVMKNTNGAITVIAQQNAFILAGTLAYTFSIPFTDINVAAPSPSVFIYVDLSNPTSVNMGIQAATRLVGCYVS